ncbi:hypothetical protein PIB30_035351 [Stylosanthes scabra]|uniref:Uncharacterized protein n=1 Tax=Stylosanthes scabra TaxID=79078 RepID=A0ABU6VG02_9FABA|nr:hypothetical protein [Stylosanthes scabra]
MFQMQVVISSLAAQLRPLKDRALNIVIYVLYLDRERSWLCLEFHRLKLKLGGGSLGCYSWLPRITSWGLCLKWLLCFQVPLDTYVPYGDWREKRVRGPVRQRRQPPSQDEPAEQLPQPETFAAPSAPTQLATDHSYKHIMRHLEMQERLLHRQGRQIANTQLMIRQAFPDTVFEGLVSDDSSESQEF